MERLILPIFAMFGFFSSLFMDVGSASGLASVTQTSKADIQGDS